MNDAKRENLTNKIIIEFSKTLEMFNLNQLEARLFAYLYLSEKPLTLDEMSEALGKSKTSMSTGIRSLSDVNLVTRVWKKGIRKDLYQANSQLFKSFMNWYINKWIEAANHQKDSLLEIDKEIRHEQDNEDASENLANLEKQLKAIIQFHNEVEILFRDIKQE
ncbi:transcriptional regulator [Virgibacillus indicus]|uniref:HTH-type transcriptional regulator n=1 Tax=Virgibacillus indicus TaxID=2024554 RepID=A0A265N7E3_9BACI|nr:helix-turn-helix domain-containing protein [Virgibacillus indicus]OZU87922.1 transcriptional regulator [Virgibacillus indicus]